MFWADQVVADIKKRYADKIKRGEEIIIRDEKTASGRVHVGSLRGVAIHGLISDLLTEAGIKHKYIYEINDFDPMDGLPVYLDQDFFRPHMGKVLCNVPSPDAKTDHSNRKDKASAKNFPEYFASEFTDVIGEIGFKPEYYRSSDVYKSGAYNSFIKIALEKADIIRDIYKTVSGSQKEDEWLPLNVICEKCGKVGTTRASDFDGKTVAYTCGNFVEWATGCCHSGRVSPFDGNAKLPWKVEWAAKFSVLNVDVEGGGKDHSTKGGAREIADAISRSLFNRQPPINIPYEFFLVGGKKMSSSKGAGSSSREVADLLPPELLRFLIIQKDPLRTIDFVLDGDTMPVLYDNYDTFAKKYFDQVQDDFANIFRLSHLNIKNQEKKLAKHYLPRFSQIVFLSQMPHLEPAKEIEKLAEVTLTEADKEEVLYRISYAKRWLELYAPESYKFEIQKTMPAIVATFTLEQKAAIKKVLDFIKSKSVLDGQELHQALHNIRAETALDPKVFFTPIYQSILGKDSGPKAGWFLSVLDRDFLIARLEEVTKTSC